MNNKLAILRLNNGKYEGFYYEGDMDLVIIDQSDEKTDVYPEIPLQFTLIEKDYLEMAAVCVETCTEESVAFLNEIAEREGTGSLEPLE